MESLSLRPAREDEIDWINATYRAIEFQQSDFDNEYILIAEIENERVGLGKLVKIDEDNIELAGVYVRHEYRGAGIADHIVNYLCEVNPFDTSVVMWCLPFEHLVGFYAKFGFSPCQMTTLPDGILKKINWCSAYTKCGKNVPILCKMNHKTIADDESKTEKLF